jgi:hypothetical protein
MPPEGPQRGFLAIADISGYTALLTGTELEHAQGIIEDLCHAIHRALVPPLTLVKLEGDALFCYALAARFPVADRILETVEACYARFLARIEEMERRTTCTCAACASIGTLDLKFVLHVGDFLIRQIGGASDLAGPDVILVHRLLKNSVSQQFGLTGYLLVTESVTPHLPSVAAWQALVEPVDGLGDVSCRVADLRPAAAARREAQRAYVSADDADVAVIDRLAAPPPLVWQYFLDPDKSTRWGAGLKSIAFERNRAGALGVDALAHCDHGSWSSDMRYLDWRPFSYYTLERTITRGSLMAAPAAVETMELVPNHDGSTELHYRLRARTAGGRLKLRLFAPVIRREFRAGFRKLEAALREDGLIG